MKEQNKEFNSPSDFDMSQNKPLIERIEIKGTPFTAIKFDDGDFFLTLGIYKITDPQFKSVDEICQHLAENTWDIMLHVMQLVAYDTIKNINSQKNDN